MNYLNQYGRWRFAQPTNVYQLQDGFANKVQAGFDRMIDNFTQGGVSA